MPITPASSPTSSFSSTFSATSSNTSSSSQNTLYDIVYSQSSKSSDPPRAAGTATGTNIVPATLAGCRHIARYKHQLKAGRGGGGVRGGTSQDATENADTAEVDPRFVENLRTLVRYSLAWEGGQRNIAGKGTRGKGTQGTVGSEGVGAAHEVNGAGSIKRRKRLDKLPLPQCLTCHTTLGRLHVCLHCVFMGCWADGHMMRHMKEKGHGFAMDFSHRNLYCVECKDYVYDLEILDRIVRLETLRVDIGEPPHKKPRYVEWHPSDHEIELIAQKANLMACQGIRGLCNMGSTCFMNVILQSLIHNPLLRAYFLSDRHNSNMCATKNCMCCEMDKLFVQLYSGDRRPYGPTSFLQAMWLSSKELVGYAQQDAHEFFISALNQIHTNCAGSKNHGCTCIIHQTFAGLLQSDVTCLQCQNVTTAYDPMLDVSLGLRPVERKKRQQQQQQEQQQQQQQQPATTVVTEVEGANASAAVGVETVEVVVAGTIAGMGVGTEATGAAVVGTREGGMAEAARAGVETGTATGGRKGREGNSLVDCLDRYTHPEKLGPKYNCRKCGNTLQEATKQLSVKKLPPVLSFQLKRFEHGTSATKIETKIKFPVELDMSPYTTSAKRTGFAKGGTASGSASDNGVAVNGDVAKPQTPALSPTSSYLYTLFAVVNHQGKLDTGHYTMFAKHRGEWFKFDDHNVTLAYQKDVLESNAYMCFYVKKALEYDFPQHHESPNGKGQAAIRLEHED